MHGRPPACAMLISCRTDKEFITRVEARGVAGLKSRPDSANAAAFRISASSPGVGAAILILAIRPHFSWSPAFRAPA